MLRGEEFATGELSEMKPLQRCFSYCVLFIFIFFLWCHFFESQCYKKKKTKLLGLWWWLDKPEYFLLLD